jgi:hypothetical protein
MIGNEPRQTDEKLEDDDEKELQGEEIQGPS